MKDAQVKSVNVMPKTKPGIKKAKISAKKVKELKVLSPNSAKMGKEKKAEKKAKQSKVDTDSAPKKKRGRPRNEEKFLAKKAAKEKQLTKTTEKKVSRKRKVPPSTPPPKNEKQNHSPIKKLKLNELSFDVNGNVKLPLPTFHRPCIQKGMSPTVVTHTITNNINNGNGICCKKSLEFPRAKPVVASMTKTVTFHPQHEMLNGDSVPKSFKAISPKNIKSILKNEIVTNFHPKENVTKPKEIKNSKANNAFVPFKSPVKLHPQRMASLDALAKMAVICIPDRKPVEHHTKSTTSVVTVCSRSDPFTHQKSSLTQCHERIQFDLKKDCKGNVVHKQINVVKEKQQVFVSHSVEQSQTVSTEPLNEAGKKKKAKSTQKCSNSTKKGQKAKTPSQVKKTKALTAKEDKKLKSAKGKELVKPTKSCNKVSKVTKKPETTKGISKATTKKSNKLEQTKSEVKVKETIHMQKTCTYQSVTTVNSHASTNTSVPVSRVGLTANYSKTQKTLMTDEECKKKIDYSSSDSIMNNSYCMTSESPCSVEQHPECCKFHAHSSPQIIPFAHVQSCGLTHGLNRTSDSSSAASGHCDGNFLIHRIGHQQAVIYSPASECSCCYSNSLVQKIHEPCLMRKSIVTYPHVHSHHSHSPSSYSTDSLCSECHQSSVSMDHHLTHFSVPSSPTQTHMSCCCEVTHPSHSNQSCLQYLPSPKTSTMQCEQSPLDLSLASTSSASSIETEIAVQTGHCPSSMCCSRDMLVLRSPHSYQHNKMACCRYIKQVTCAGRQSNEQQVVQCATKSAAVHQQSDRVALLASPASVTKSSTVVSPVPSTSGVISKSSRVVSATLIPTKREKSLSPKQTLLKLSPTKKRQFAHGWSWKGKPKEKLIALTNDSAPCPRICYPSVEHVEGDIIREKDCVLLKSGPKDTDLPYVAKIAAFWENPEDGEMMMSLLWYYRPEHTDQGRKSGQMEDEVFASKHKDVNSIACIEDKCYVLTFNEYCRYRASLRMAEDMYSMASLLVPPIPDGYPRKPRLPFEAVTNDIVFFCRHVYDFRQKRILKNPT